MHPNAELTPDPNHLYDPLPPRLKQHKLKKAIIHK